MSEGRSSHVGLLSLTIWKMTGDEIGEVKKPKCQGMYIKQAGERLPYYCLRNDNHKVDISEEYLQWINEGKEEYYLFEFSADDIIGEEIGNVGLEEFMDIHNWNWAETFEKLHINKHDQFIPTTSYLIFKINWWREWTHYGYEYDLDWGLEGYLNSNLERINLC